LWSAALPPETQLAAWRFCLVDIRRGKLEGVAHELESGLGIFGNDHFDYVEPKKDLGIIEHAQPGESAARDLSLFLAADRFNRPAEIFACARFYFDKDERVAIAADDVDLAAGSPFEIATKNLITVPPQESAGQFLPTRAAPQVLGF
jgi:hypothetical protein